VADGAPALVAGAAAVALRVRFAAPVALDDLAAALRAERAGVVVEHAPGDPLAVTVSGAPPDARLVAAVATWAAERGVLVAELRTTGGSLEERYLELTGDRDVERSA
jgi:hypothetical protein